MTQCKTIRHLELLITDTADPHSVVARHAMEIIKNIDEHGPSKPKLECLQLVLIPLCENTGFPLTDHLIGGEADCDICAAMKNLLTA